MPDSMRSERAGLLASRSVYWLRLTILKSSDSGKIGAFVARYSGATARDLHPVSLFSPSRGKGHSSEFPLLHNSGFENELGPLYKLFGNYVNRSHFIKTIDPGA